MESLQTKLDVIANNLANVNTTGFKRDRANFEDLFYRHEVLPGALDASGQLTPVGTQIGLGSRVSSTQTDFDQGAFQQSSRQLDVAIEGNGFFQVIDPATGQTLYTRAGNFSINANNAVGARQRRHGAACSSHRSRFRRTRPALSFRRTARSRCGRRAKRRSARSAQMQLATFINPQGLLKLGENLYAETDASGSAAGWHTRAPTASAQLRQNSLEARTSSRCRS